MTNSLSWRRAVVGLVLVLGVSIHAQPGHKIVLFYNASTGAAAVGTIEGDTFATKLTYPPGAFAKGWTHVADVPLSGGVLIFYNASTGEGATGKLTDTGFTTTKTYGPGAFGQWTTIVGLMPSGKPARVLFYNAGTGAGALGFDPTDKIYPAGAFGRGWSHIVQPRGGPVLFYNASTGAGALGFDPTVKIFREGEFTTGWTHVAVTSPPSGASRILFYNSQNGSGALGSVTNGSFTTVKSYGQGSFGTWTHVAGYSDGFLFYNSGSGAGAIAIADGNDVVTKKSYPKGAFATNWTLMVGSDSAILTDGN